MNRLTSNSRWLIALVTSSVAVYPAAAESTDAKLGPATASLEAKMPDEGASVIAAMLKDDGFMRLDFKRALDRSPLPINSIRDERGRGLLHIAAEETLLNQFILLLLFEADPNLRDAEGRTPLHYVVSGEQEFFKIMRDGLLLRKADVNAADNSGATPLMVAAQAGNTDAVEILLWLGADPAPKSVTSDRWPIALARQAHQDKVVALLQASASSTVPTLAVTPRQIPGFVQRSFTEAARLADFDRLQALELKGAELDGQDAKGSTALLQAIANRQANVVSYLLMRGANPDAPNKKGYTPYMAASGWFIGWGDWMRDMLILAGMDAKKVHPNGHNALTMACQKGNEHAAQWAIWAGADPNEAAPVGTPMHIASKEGQQKIIKLLQLNGVTEPLYVEPDPARRLILAARRDDAKEVLALLAEGVPVDSADEHGNSALMNAIYSQRFDIARLLLQHGAGVNFKNPQNGNTPLRATTVWTYHEIEIFRVELLEAGADPNLPDQKGITPFMSSCMGGGLSPMITQMLKYGAKLNLRDAKGHTGLWYSRQDGRTEAYEFLKSQGAVE